MSLEGRFDAAFVAGLALKEKQIQQNYRPIIGIHKWFARRPGTLFRGLLLAEYGDEAEDLRRAYFRGHSMRGVIADPFMGGGTTLIEANRLGFHVIGADINPMSYWLVKQELAELDDAAFAAIADIVAETVDTAISPYTGTRCVGCGEIASVKYWIWVKSQACPHCGVPNDLFPGYLLADNSRHPSHVIACADCGALVECHARPSSTSPASCPRCGGRVQVDGPAKRGSIACRACKSPFRYPDPTTGAPAHRIWALEYFCSHCKPTHKGRFFKEPDTEDLARVIASSAALSASSQLRFPSDAIPDGDETSRLRRWGYEHWRDLFNPRQLLGLGELQGAIDKVPDQQLRYPLLTVFSDILRYQNMLCRYDTSSLKCQDIFSVHGFPVGLVQCENNLLGIPSVGSGGFRHFVEKYRRAKAYCRAPFETRWTGSRKQKIVIDGERIGAPIVGMMPQGSVPQAYVSCAPSAGLNLPPASLDGVFTDPPYFANVQYAELIDFCYVWLRQSLVSLETAFQPETTRHAMEVSGNVTQGRGILHFSEGLSAVFRCYAAALKPGAPFVFTYHHNDPEAYAPLVMALLDAGLLCTAVLPAPAEMEASIHINNTVSSILDSVFVSRREGSPVGLPTLASFHSTFLADCKRMEAGGVRLSHGDAQCLMSGHIARWSVQHLWSGWDPCRPTAQRLDSARATLRSLATKYGAHDSAAAAADSFSENRDRQLTLFDLEDVHGAAV